MHIDVDRSRSSMSLSSSLSLYMNLCSHVTSSISPRRLFTFLGR